MRLRMGSKIYKVRGRVWRISEHMNNLAHGGAGGAFLLHTHHRDLEQVHHPIERISGEPRIHYRQHHCSIRWVRHLTSRFKHPPHYVDAFPKLSNGLPPRDQLQKHYSKAIHIALLVYFQRVGVLCSITNMHNSINILRDLTNMLNKINTPSP